jgi:hypothetical protein
MNRLLATLLTLSALFLASACSDEPDLPPVGQDRHGTTYDPGDFLSRHAAPSAPGESSAEITAFLATLRPLFHGVTDEELIGLGELACGWLDDVETPDAHTIVMLDRYLQRELHTGPDMNGALVGAAVVALCPQHQSLLDAT